MNSILSDLNDSQREAVVHAGSPLLVVAGAGSGKTRVITRRIAYRIQEGLRPSEVLAITFTNKAAGEMRERVDQLIGSSRAWISTFHALGARFLRMEADAAGIDRNFTIFDTQDQATQVREILKELRLTGRQHRPRDYLAGISGMKNRGERPPEPGEPVDDLLLRIYRAYEQALESSQALDFDDLLCRTVRLLEQNEAVRRRFAGRFRTLLIDEYQDTNRLQYRLARLLVKDHDDICATGDPDQSIYRWRGAEIRNILEFERDFPGTRIVKLEQNYRSTNCILRAAGGLISHNRFRVERELRSDLGEGELVRVVAALSETEESSRIVASIREVLDQGAAPDEIAIFYRTNACSRPLEQALRLANLPYVIVGAVEFYERREIKDLLAYLRIIVNPFDVLDLTRVINVPSRGIGARTVARLREHVRRSGLPFREVLRDPGAVAGLKPRGLDAVAEFASLLDQLLEMPRSPVLPVLDRVLELTRYRRYLEEADDPLVDERLENVEELRRALREFNGRIPEGTLDQFLNETVLLRARDQDREDVPSVTLMTLHAAKGLEYKTVFIAALEEGILPHSRSMEAEEALEEERRLLYVGMTRAQRRLTLCYSMRRSAGGAWSLGSSIPSRFLGEIPEDCVAREGGARRGLAGVDDSSFYEPDLDGDEPPFEPGDHVYHEHFGRGRVLRLTGYGPAAKVTVDFVEGGQKRLILEYARLRKTYEEF